MRSISYTSNYQVICNNPAKQVLIGLNPALTQANMPYILGNIATSKSSFNKQGATVYTYGFTYNELQLVIPTPLLKSSDITGVLCADFLNTYLNSLVVRAGSHILNGVGTPQASLGSISDFYIATDTEVLYGPKSSLGWGSGVSLVGGGGNACSSAPVFSGDLIVCSGGSSHPLVASGASLVPVSNADGTVSFQSQSGGSGWSDWADITLTPDNATSPTVHNYEEVPQKWSCRRNGDTVQISFHGAFYATDPTVLYANFNMAGVINTYGISTDYPTRLTGYINYFKSTSPDTTVKGTFAPCNIDLVPPLLSFWLLLPATIPAGGNLVCQYGIEATFRINNPGTVVTPPVVVPPIARKAEWLTLMEEWGGYMSQWFTNNPAPANNDARLTMAYYDMESVAYTLATLNPVNQTQWYALADQGYNTYVTNYVIPAGGQAQGFRNYGDGLATAYKLGRSAADHKAAFDLLFSHGYHNADGGSDLTTQEMSREVSYALTNFIHATVDFGETLSPTQIARRLYLKGCAIDHCNHWAVAHDAAYCRPFMVGLTAKALIYYYNNISPDTDIIVALSAVANYIWSTCWVPASNSFLYTDRDGTGQPWSAGELDTQVAPDLNMLVAPMFAWLYHVTGITDWRTKADAIFNGGIPVYSGQWWSSGAYLGTRSASNPNGKQYNQQLFWALDYISNAEATPVPVAIP